MTNQNVVVSDCNVVAMTVAMANNSGLFSPVAAASLPKQAVGGGGGAGGYISISRKNNSSKKIENNNSSGGRAKTVNINAWVDAMRASSPTRKSSLFDDSTDDDHKSWILQHPSALEMFEEMMKAASQGKQIVIFLDYDGTLSPIVEDPEQAFMTNEMREAVRNVAKCFPTAIVSGRCRAKVYNFVKLSELFYAGSHGMDIKGPAKSYIHRNDNHGVLFQPAKEFVPMMNNVYKTLLEKTKYIPGAKVENNKFCLSVHFRRVDENLWAELAQKVKSVLKEYPKLKLTQGRKVLEIRPTIKWDKGKALEFLLESLGYANSDKVLPVYIGDDRTDEDAFKVLREKGQGIGILVSRFPKETAASYSLREPLELRTVMDPKRHYKKVDHKSDPKYFQVGTIIESSTEFFTGRLTKKERKATLADEILGDHHSLGSYRKRKVREIQEKNEPGGVDKWKIKGRQSLKRAKQKKALMGGRCPALPITLLCFGFCQMREGPTSE